MDRRAFFQRAALIAAGTVAADQLDLLERLTYKRRFFPSAHVHRFDDFRVGPPGLWHQQGTWGRASASEYLAIVGPDRDLQVWRGSGTFVVSIPGPVNAGDIFRLTVET